MEIISGAERFIMEIEKISADSPYSIIKKNCCATLIQAALSTIVNERRIINDAIGLLTDMDIYLNKELREMHMKTHQTFYKKINIRGKKTTGVIHNNLSKILNVHLRNTEECYSTEGTWIDVIKLRYRHPTQMTKNQCRHQDYSLGFGGGYQNDCHQSSEETSKDSKAEKRKNLQANR